MPLSTEDAVRETLRVALEENLRKNLYTQEEFDRYAEIAKEAAQRIDAEKDAFRANYHHRVSDATVVILREHEARKLDYPKPDWAVDVPPPGSLPSAWTRRISTKSCTKPVRRENPREKPPSNATECQTRVVP
mgnify:CR=1 FL=1